MTTPITTTVLQPTNMAGLYYNYIIPLGLKNLIMSLIGNSQGNVNSPQLPVQQSSRMWVSQPRPATDSTTEVLSIKFIIPVSISQLSFEALRVSCAYEIWYVDAMGNTRQVLDPALNPVLLNLSPSGTQSWYTASFQIYPIVCTSLQFRITRVPSSLTGIAPYVVGMRNTLLRRDIYTRDQGVETISQQQDVMGNVITSYIRDWSASNVVNNHGNSFWKSGPQPSADAVVALYLDVRDPSGGAQVVDTVYINPVYSGNNLNLYYSNDDTVGTLTVSPESLLPIQENVEWQQGVGLVDVSSTIQSSTYEFPMDWGPLTSQDTWIGVEWAPNFSSTPDNSVQTIDISGSPTGGAFVLEFINPNTDVSTNTSSIAYNAADLDVQDALSLVVGNGNVKVTGPDGGPWTVTFQNVWGGINIPTMGSINNLLGGQSPEITITQNQQGGSNPPPPQNCVLFGAAASGVDGVSAVQTITVEDNPTGGVFTLSYGGVVSSALSPTATPNDVLTALNTIPALAGNVTVQPVTEGGKGFLITFTGDLAHTPVELIRAQSYLSGSPVSGPTQVVDVEGASGGTFALLYQGQRTAQISSNATAAAMQQALNEIEPNGSNPYTFFPETQVITLVGQPAGGSYTLSWSGTGSPIPSAGSTGEVEVTNVTNQIAYNAPPSVVASALNELSGLAPANVTVTGPAGGPYTVQFTGTAVSGPQPMIHVESATLTGGNDPVVTIQRTQAGDVPISVSGPTGGPWSVTIGGVLSGQTALLGIDGSLLDPASATATVSYASPVVVAMTTSGQDPVATINTSQYNPTLYYDPGASAVTLAFTNPNSTAIEYECAVSDFSPETTVRVVAGWSYSPDTVSIMVQDDRGNILGSYSSTVTNLPAQVSVDGTVTFENFKGTFTAHILKLENYSTSTAFLANPQIYVTPQPVTLSGSVPVSQQNAILMSSWTTQQFPNGGGDASKYASKAWTPIFSNYITEKGDLILPSAISMKYLMLELTNLTPQAYPLYDTGISVNYQAFPASVTQTSTQPLGQIGELAGLLSMGADVVLSGVGSVNWVNPQTVSNAVNSVFGQTYQPMLVTTGGATNTNLPAIPNTANQSLNGQARSEVASPVVYRRPPQNAATLAGQVINAATTAAPSTQGLSPSLPPGTVEVGNGITWTPNVSPGNSPPTIPVQGDDWWVFPGGTLRMPAQVMNGLTGNTEVSLGPGLSTVTRYRFNTTCVHVYDTRTVTLDAAIAYFAGIQEIQPYVSHYIATQDPATFNFTRYNLDQWSGVNVTALTDGPVTTSGTMYAIENPDFDPDEQFLVGVDGQLIAETAPSNENDYVNDWIQAQGTWSWDGTMGQSGPIGAATVTADGTDKILLSSFVMVTPGDDVDLGVWASWSGLTTSSNEAIQLQAWFYEGTPPDPNDPDVVTQTLSRQWTYLSQFNSLSSTTAANTGADDWAHMSGTVSAGNPFVVPDNATYMRVALVVTPQATAGQVWFDNVSITGRGIEGQLSNSFTTFSNFVKLTCSIQDSGTVRSDSMWELPDVNGSTAQDTALAYYVDTIPDVIPAGMWGDTIADWSDPHIAWGEPRAVVAIQLDPNRTYDGKRVIKFTRAAGSGVAGMQMRQQTNFIPNGLCRLGCVFLKPNLAPAAGPTSQQVQPQVQDTNTIQIELRRTSDGLVVHSETFTPVQGYWYTYLTQFFEIPDSDDQIYTLSVVLSGDMADSLYLSDMWCEIANIRYFVTLGGDGEYMHDITPLAYTNGGKAVVSSPQPVNSFDVDVTILSPSAYVYSSQFTPLYLQ